jgi:hypothetical protein
MAQIFIDKGVAILDLPMILLPNEIINKYKRIKEVMDRQICTNYDNKQSFFCKVLELIQMYDMP